MNAPRPLVVAINAVLLAGFAGETLAAVNTAGLVYTPITPCRIVDTRVTGGPFAAKETRTFQTNGAATQGGGACTVYSGTIPTALSLNVTVDATSLGSTMQYGFLSVTPTPGPGSSWMNFFGGQTVANAGVATINQLDGTFAIKTQNPANVIIDVSGYFSEQALQTFDFNASFNNGASGLTFAAPNGANPVNYSVVPMSCTVTALYLGVLNIGDGTGPDDTATITVFHNAARTSMTCAAVTGVRLSSTGGCSTTSNGFPVGPGDELTLQIAESNPSAQFSYTTTLKCR